MIDVLRAQSSARLDVRSRKSGAVRQADELLVVGRTTARPFRSGRGAKCSLREGVDPNKSDTKGKLISIDGVVLVGTDPATEASIIFECQLTERNDASVASLG